MLSNKGILQGAPPPPPEWVGGQKQLRQNELSPGRGQGCPSPPSGAFLADGRPFACGFIFLFPCPHVRAGNHRGVVDWHEAAATEAHWAARAHVCVHFPLRRICFWDRRS